MCEPLRSEGHFSDGKVVAVFRIQMPIVHSIYYQLNNRTSTSNLYDWNSLVSYHCLYTYCIESTLLLTRQLQLLSIAIIKVHHTEQQWGTVQIVTQTTSTFLLFGCCNINHLWSIYSYDTCVKLIYYYPLAATFRITNILFFIMTIVVITAFERTWRGHAVWRVVALCREVQLAPCRRTFDSLRLGPLPPRPSCYWRSGAVHQALRQY